MRDMPMKVVALLSTEVGITLGMGVVLYFSIRTVIKATVEGQWKALRDL